MPEFTSSFAGAFWKAENEYRQELEDIKNGIWESSRIDHCITSFANSRHAFSAAPKIQLMKYILKRRKNDAQTTGNKQRKSLLPISEEMLKGECSLSSEDVHELAKELKSYTRGKIGDYGIIGYRSWSSLFEEILMSDGCYCFLRKSSIYLDKDTTIKIGYALGFSLIELQDFLLRASEDGLLPTCSSDIIDAYCFSANYDIQKSRELKRVYSNTRNHTDPKAVIIPVAPIGFTREAADYFQGLTDRLDSEKGNTNEANDRLFMDWMKEKSLYLDRPSRTAYIIFVNLFWKLIEDSENEIGNNRRAFKRERDYAESIRNYCLDKTDEDKNGSFDDGMLENCDKLTDEEVEEMLDLFCKNISRYYYGYPYPAQEGWLKTIPFFGRLAPILKREKPVTKNDLLLLLCYIYGCGPNIENKNLTERGQRFASLANQLLRYSYLQEFYWVHPLELAGMLSVMTETPIENWNPEQAAGERSEYITVAATNLWTTIRESICGSEKSKESVREKRSKLLSWIVDDPLTAKFISLTKVFLSGKPEGFGICCESGIVKGGQIKETEQESKSTGRKGTLDEVIFTFSEGQWPESIYAIKSSDGTSLYDYSCEYVHKKNCISLSELSKNSEGDPEALFALEHVKIGYILEDDPDLPKIIERTAMLMYFWAIADQIQLPQGYIMKLDVKPDHQKMKIVRA